MDEDVQCGWKVKGMLKMGEWPEEVVSYYNALADDRGWPEDVREAFFQTIEFYRQLDSESATRNYFQVMDEGVRWIFETVTVEKQFVPVKQVQVFPDGKVLKYSWQHLEDSDGGLAESAINPDYEGIESITADEFAAIWISES